MITPEQIQKVLESKFPSAQVQVIDMTGTLDHFQASVKWNGFQGKNLIAQHQLVNQALEEWLADGSIHALKIKTMV